MVNLNSIQALRDYAFVNGLRGTYDFCEDIVSDVLGCNEDSRSLSDRLFRLCCCNNTTPFEEYLKINPILRNSLQLRAIAAIKRLVNDGDFSKKIAFLDCTSIELIKDIAQLL